MFDSHCHLHDARMRDQADAYLARARSKGVTGFMLAGVDPEGWKDEQALCLRHNDVFAAYGLHPQVVAEWSDAQCLEAVTQLSLYNPRVIGEIGLDALTPARRATLPLQTHVLRAQLSLARERDVPVVLHILRAHEEALHVLTRDTLPKAGGVVHSYSGSRDLLDRYLALDLHISLAGSVTYTNAVKAPQVARDIALDRLLVETDAPDQTPQPHRPGMNEPAFLGDVIAAIAAIRGATVQSIAEATAANARRLYRL